MAIITYDIDPDGDICLVLKDPNSHSIVPITGKRVKDNSNDAFENLPLVGRYEVFNKAVKDASVDAFGELPPVSDTDTTEVHMRVSSRHLILASRIFHKMLKGDWRESSSKNVVSGLWQIQTSGWDAAALAIVLDVIHGRHRGIPTYTNLGLLTRIATIVDYYEFHESLQLMSDIWMTALRAVNAVPTKYCQSALLWLYTSWVFSERIVISSITKMLLESSDGLSEIDSLDLPVGGIVDIIKTKREELISKLINGLDDLRKTLTEENVCLRQSSDTICSATMLGILMRETHKLKLLDPPLDPPYNGHSISSLKEKIANFPKPRQEFHNVNPYGAYSSDPCTVHSRMAIVFKEIDDDMESFDLTPHQ
ncbi:hypothetical protein NW768_002900 [Fusarium equiseti]|uniref:BTB domain-containing protein n=1 Tax=Fusarium equiseti TaxID=61235 RepID=A0ABQ8RKI9_FUSEQ|nr:hypothetical protein NW768_002900 [Fusarium equiseti]